jgi:hypothetical protein
VHYRYALIMLHVICAFIYGTCIPILYLTALLAFVVLYISERITVCYIYREPVPFDEEITLKCLRIIYWVPVISLPLVFWQLGNR